MSKPAAAFHSERYLRVDGRAPVFADDLTGDYPTRDGWVRLHRTDPSHREAVLTTPPAW